ELDERLKLYLTVVQAFSPPHLPKLPTEEEMKADSSAIQQYMTSFKSVMGRTASAMTAMKAPRVIPMSFGDKATPEDSWQPYPVAYAMATIMDLSGQKPDEATLGFNAIISAYHQGDATRFNNEVAKYDTYLTRYAPPLWNK